MGTAILADQRVATVHIPPDSTVPGYRELPVKQIVITNKPQCDKCRRVSREVQIPQQFLIFMHSK